MLIRVDRRRTLFAPDRLVHHFPEVLFKSLATAVRPSGKVCRQRSSARDRTPPECSSSGRTATHTSSSPNPRRQAVVPFKCRCLPEVPEPVTCASTPSQYPTIEARLKISDPLKLRNSPKNKRHDVAYFSCLPVNR